ncbi:MAG: CoA-acylating methylmalonate-semialdehyde dehydrogenase [Candidatus Eiseniibacteriota bacterium]|nr:MAG: CoA-acylating methylmalonate-semialdehyde dehydrogenase [Candidatus Eisenbacteria bacterium]
MSFGTLRNYVGGKWVSSKSTQFLDVRNPATDEVLAQVPLSTKQEVNEAVSEAKKAFTEWREVPPVVRARYFFNLRNLLEEHFEDISRLLVQENGKTLAEARGSMRRAVEMVEVSAGIPSLMMGHNLEDIAPGIDCVAVRQPLGVFACITPFNFPAMVPLWFLPFAVACGNTFVVKPSEQTPLCQKRIFELMHDVGFPPGVVNMVNGAKDAVNALLENKDVIGVSFVGSSPVARYVYETAGKRGKRVQALGGAKNFLVVMPDADLDSTVAALIDSCFGCAGERCLAGSVLVAVGDVYDKLKAKFLEAAKKVVVGYGLDEGTTMGPVISRKHKEKVLGYIASGVRDGAGLLLDGRNVKVNGYPNGYFVGPTVFENVEPSMPIAKEEIFGPVVSLMRVASLEEALELISQNEFGNATSIFTQSGGAAREFAYRVGISMIGINIGIAAPMAFFTFGGAKGSFFGDLKAHGRDSVEFFTDKRVIISRWF